MDKSGDKGVDRFDLTGGAYEKAAKVARADDIIHPIDDRPLGERFTRVFPTRESARDATGCHGFIPDGHDGKRIGLERDAGDQGHHIKGRCRVAFIKADITELECIKVVQLASAITRDRGRIGTRLTPDDFGSHKLHVAAAFDFEIGQGFDGPSGCRLLG